MKAGPGSGGKRKGAGRPPNWLRLKCQKIIEKDKLVEFLANVAAGRVQDHRMTKDGDVVEIPASLNDRIECAKYLSDQAGGKAPQAMQLQDGDGQPITFKLVSYGNNNPV